MVMEEDGSACLEGASVEVHGLTLGLAVTLRASAPGYASRDVILVPSTGLQTALIVELK